MRMGEGAEGFIYRECYGGGKEDERDSGRAHAAYGGSFGEESPRFA